MDVVLTILDLIFIVVSALNLMHTDGLKIE